MQLVAQRRSSVAGRALPIACGCALAASAVLVTVNDPAAPGNHFPPCLFHATTGLWCPGCGLTRATHALFRGHLGTALGLNLFTPLMLLGIAWAWVSWMRTSWGLQALTVPPAVRRGLTTVAPVVLIVFTVLRNIPALPFRALAP